jgi:pimeloyl-ACP methyl ester carboxylesterase
MKLKLIFNITFFIISFFTFSQESVPFTNYSRFSIKTKKDTIDFVVADTNLNSKKPILLFCQGSQPLPLFMDFNQNQIVPVSLSNFDIDKLNEKYHTVVISMPHTPLIVHHSQLNEQYNYITDTTNPYSYSVDYLLADYSENYVRRANEVLHFLKKQKWVDNQKLVVMGHSQGARIALELAASNKNITKLGLFGYNPNGRIDKSIRFARKTAEKGLITWHEADSMQNAEIDLYKMVWNSDSVKNHPSLVSWKSFSKSTMSTLAHLKIPVYIAYGSDDITSDLCDLIPIYFVENNKLNYVLKRYPNLEHNFFPVNEKGTVDYENGKWKEVMNSFVEWSEIN